MTLIGSEIDAAEWTRLAAIAEGQVPTVTFLQTTYASAFGGLRRNPQNSQSIAGNDIH